MAASWSWGKRRGDGDPGVGRRPADAHGCPRAVHGRGGSAPSPPGAAPAASSRASRARAVPRHPRPCPLPRPLGRSPVLPVAPRAAHRETKYTYTPSPAPLPPTGLRPHQRSGPPRGVLLMKHDSSGSQQRYRRRVRPTHRAGPRRALPHRQPPVETNPRQ